MQTMMARAILAVVFAASAATPVLAQPSSAALAKELTAALTTRHLDAFAARDTEAADAFVAALVYPEVQLLVVSARYPVPAHLAQMLAAANYKDAYSALYGSGVPASKLFVQDMGADGLRSEERQTVDIVYRKDAHQTILSGDVDDADYRKNLAAADAEYSRVLRALLAGVAAAPVATATAAVR